MTPEQRKRLENNWLPFCAMDPDDRQALEGSDGPWMFLSGSGRWKDTVYPGWNVGCVYRLATQPKRKPVVQWQYIHKDVVAVAMNKDQIRWTLHEDIPVARDGPGFWDGCILHTMPSCLVGPGLMIDPGDLTRDDWKESLMIRPGYGQSE